MALSLVVPGRPAVAAPVRDPGWADQLALGKAWELSRGEGVVVGLVDTGVDPAVVPAARPGAAFPDLGTGTGDATGHGTAMAALVAGVAPEAAILPAKLNGGAAAADEAIRWVVDHGARVVNLSLGSGRPDSTAYDEGLRYAREHDAVVVAAAGNAATDPGVVSPADRPGVLAVSAVDRTGRFRADVSVAGPEVALAAPGVDLAAAGGRHTGTSGAAALVSGVVALIRARYPGLDAAAVVDLLLRTARDAGPPGRDDEYGAGVVDPVRALTSGPDPPHRPYWLMLLLLPAIAAILGIRQKWR